MSLGLLQILMRVKVMAIPEGLEGLITPTHVLGVHRQSPGGAESASSPELGD
ncbi:hypothetical protein I307_03334 [Cryptococcus deuterogattii 99/473]|uniref:Uncharacterized protein n=1 Tax=Cryptococcus deuterogattii Ram5 TaxID=1296110 RepID=A0A0D0TYI2_9TREE|nr:hypothetical protein I309_04500 [Cryptococcus deuterogattii LA55]KIR33156.1 hypothetical protein I352_04527 [Cryptococcus deuterogattii MMRL2647]KIR40968.1 hypothetical protein I313_02914 [Cryptococcus deuterogattii Ram5]KIR91915.1 hypothetical protein I304_04077 [Cryptococcus deuterogattii CBS 10090]KIR97726.1 hypothetical protein L804_04868 [Cryptococcus deuterogattii 2001/935-1]KIY57410.1 hypothetical protein I307_03334 [Cryptococcus deuterogattii 99/473]